MTGTTCQKFSPVILLVKSPVMVITSPSCRFLKVSLTTPISLRISRIFLLMTKMFHLDATSRKFSIFFSLERGFIISFK